MVLRFRGCPPPHVGGYWGRTFVKSLLTLLGALAFVGDADLEIGSTAELE